MPAPARRPTSCWPVNSSGAGAPQLPSPPPMSQPPKSCGLGRGLSALLGDDEVAATVAPPPAAPAPAAAPEAAAPPTGQRAASRAPLTLPIGQLRAGRMQPRTTFEEMDPLVDSVKEFGLLQPILVRPIP